MKQRRQALIKGSSLPVLRIVVRDGDPRSLSTDLVETIDKARPLLADAIAVLDVRERAAVDVATEDIAATVRDAGVRLAAVLIGEQHERAALAGLDLPVIEAPLSPRDRPAADATGDVVASPPATVAATAAPDARSGVVAPAVAPGEPRPRLAPLYVTRPLRSGQRVYAQGRDAVVAAPTSRGSELIADGSVYAFSPLRGRVLAGASGDTNACIVASRLDAELVAIAGVYRTLEADDLDAHGDGPVSVTLSLAADGSERLTLAPLAPLPSTQRK